MPSGTGATGSSKNAGLASGLFCLVLGACGGGSSDGVNPRPDDAGGIVADPSPFEPANDPPAESVPAEPVDDLLLAGPMPAGADVVAVADDGETVGTASLRIVLTWGESPQDLDAHLSGPNASGDGEFHVFSGDRDAGVARLVDDATMGSGPETIVIDRLGSGLHRYSVFNFSGDADRSLGGSGARVQVFFDETAMGDFTVPAGEGDLWTVFDIDDGGIVAIDTIARLRNVLDFFPRTDRAP